MSGGTMKKLTMAHCVGHDTVNGSRQREGTKHLCAPTSLMTSLFSSTRRTCVLSTLKVACISNHHHHHHQLILFVRAVALSEAVHVCRESARPPFGAFA
mmetsp:Transcript_18523/g.36342  ORF Transcript_18523/g.36342 Transcript_18523/m.36342 type:complete len:99 (-) Transcript_18523:742-1038(-)